MTDAEMLSILQSKNFGALWNGRNEISTNLIQNKIQEIPSEFFEPRICIDLEGKKHISLIQFSTELAGMSSERKRGMMEKYHINPFDLQKLQTIVDSIKVAREYGSRESKRVDSQEKNEEHYGFSLSSNDKLGKAYPLWLAYLFIDSQNPYADVSAKLKEDGMSRKYRPETIVGLIEHTNDLMKGKSIDEKKDFYIHSISDILDKPVENIKMKDTLEI